MKEKRIIVRILAAVLSIALVLAYTPATVVRADEATDGDALVSTKEIATIKNNIIINGLDVGGMTFGQAVESLGGGEDYSQAEVSLTSQYGDVVTTLGDLGLSDNTDDIVREALNYGNAGNVMEWNVVSKDKSKAVGMILQKQAVPNFQYQYFRAKGLDGSRKYKFYNIRARVNIMDFGDLVNTVSPVHCRCGRTDCVFRPRHSPSASRPFPPCGSLPRPSSSCMPRTQDPLP